MMRVGGRPAKSSWLLALVCGPLAAAAAAAAAAAPIPRLCVSGLNGSALTSSYVSLLEPSGLHSIRTRSAPLCVAFNATDPPPATSVYSQCIVQYSPGALGENVDAILQTLEYGCSLHNGMSSVEVDRSSGMASFFRLGGDGERQRQGEETAMTMEVARSMSPSEVDHDFRTSDLPLFAHNDEEARDGARGTRRNEDRQLELYEIDFALSLESGEKIFGLGQHKTGKLDNRDTRFPIQQQNTEVFIPLYHSSKGYSMLVNVPSMGSLDIGTGGSGQMKWHFIMGLQIDYWFSAHPSISQRMQEYVDATGHSQELPTWSTGLWASKNRYRNSTEFLSAAKNYVTEYGIPLSVLVIDYISWKNMGDGDFNPDCWFDVPDMVNEVREVYGAETMLSPYMQFIERSSANFVDAVDSQALALAADRKTPAGSSWHPNSPSEFGFFYDIFDSQSSAIMWANWKKHYVAEDNIKVFWLDCDEPCGNETTILAPTGDQLYWLGGRVPQGAIGMLYPIKFQEIAVENMQSSGEQVPVTLSRSAWAGSQRYSAAVWSGDVESTFESLAQQVKAGLNIQLSGVPYWTTDIGGYSHGNISDPVMQDLIVRWFQFGAFCPVFRVHGCRDSNFGKGSVDGDVCGGSCGPNEPWVYGETAYEAIRHVATIRESLRNYVQEQYRKQSQTGTPVMRPLWFDYLEGDAYSLQIDDEFLFGDRFLIAPIVEYNTSSRQVYLPGASAEPAFCWRSYFSGEQHPQYANVTFSGKSIQEFPLYEKTQDCDSLTALQT